MKDAKTLLMDVLAAIPDGNEVAALFADDGAVELPFLYSLGIEPRYQGHAAIKDFYDLVRQLYPDFAFKPEDTQSSSRLRIKFSPNISPHTTAPATSRLIHHLFAARLVVERGKIKLLRESLKSSPQFRRVIPTPSLIFKVSRPRFIRPAPNIGAEGSRQF
jgi:uncharacterized protein